MKATELRIGNLVQSRGGIIEIAEVHTGGILGHWHKSHLTIWPTYENIEPIPLTWEWTVKLGLTFVENEYRFNDNFGLHKGSDGRFWLAYYSDHCKTLFFEVLYVHQLQNLYFALTGEELEIKPL